ncbi:hypothetical protein GCM10014715_88670 [Streptomyces spiralis]|uniref:Uncharacterized protein n=1 Tax=Streptomyces spiralis TaxID=66376 RepID=A0A919AS85_9ACTN|nr:hypothetical protein GCM10014715_88670 [Streptomyces spiralis]
MVADDAGPARSADAEIGDVARDRCAGEPAEFRGGAEVVDVPVGDNDQADVLGFMSTQQQLGVDGMLAEHGNREDFGLEH